MDNDRLQQIYDDAGRPGVQAFRFAVRRAGLQTKGHVLEVRLNPEAEGHVLEVRLNTCKVD